MEFNEFGIDPENRQQLMVAFPRILILAGETAARAGDALVFEPFGLNLARYSLLIALRHAGGSISMTHLRDATFVFRSSSNFTQMVDDLEGRKLVRRVPAPDDRRVWLVELTDEGTKLVDETTAYLDKVMEEVLKEYPTGELRDALRTVIRWISQTADAAGMAGIRPRLHSQRPANRS